MLTISADLSELSPEQRQSLSNFVLTYPEIERRTLAVELPSGAVDRRLPVAEPEPLEEPSPEQAFAPAPVAQASTGLDKSGLPWNERIHSSSKALTADGLWRKKRGVDEGLVALVEGQLKQVMSLPSPATETVATIPVSQFVPLPPGPTLVAPLEVADGRQAFINLVGQVSIAIQGNKITQAEVLAVLNKYGIPTLPLLTSRFDLVAQVAMDLEAIIVGR